MEIRAMDMNSFDAVYDAIAEKIYRSALYYSGNHHTAEDITQIVLMKWYLSQEEVSEEKIEAWAKAVARNQIKNYNRNESREIKTDFDELEYMIDRITYEKGVEEILEYRYHKDMCVELIDEIYDALYQENQRWYEAAIKTYIFEKPQKEVAKEMGLSIGALRILLYRVKNWIKKQYQEKLAHLEKE